MADGTPDFADLLAAFDDTPAVSLQQITGTHGTNLHHGALQLAGNTPLHLNQPYIGNQSHGQFGNLNQREFSPQNQVNQLRQISGSLSNQNYFSPAGDVAPAQGADDSFSGGSLGSMFLSSVESLLSDEGSSSFMVQVPQQSQPATQSKPAVQRKPRQRPKQNNAQSRTPSNNLQQNNAVQNSEAFSGVRATSFNSIPQSVASPLQRPTSSHSAGLGSNVPGMNMTSSVSSPPFVMPSEVHGGTGNMSVIGSQQKIYDQGQFVHPTLGTRQAQQPSQPPNPPRPLSAASSTSEHMSRPGSVSQPSPSCGSNHSGDPATPLTPQSYNAGTPQSYNPGTPQPNMMSQQRQRASTYSDISQQMPGQPGQMPSVSNDGFASHQLSATSFQPQPSPIRPSMHSSTDSLSDLPAPLKESFISPISGTSFNHNMAPNSTGLENSLMVSSNSLPHNNSQPWMQNMINNPNAAQAVMAPDSLFMNNTQSPMIPSASTFMPSDLQLHFGMSDVGGFGVPMQSHQMLERAENNAGTSSLTSKQNQLLDQLSTFGKSTKIKPTNFVQQTSLDMLDPGSSSALPNLYSATEKSDLSRRTSLSENSTTMNMMNKANDAGVAAVKELFNSQTAQYEAISPVSDYAMSPVNKTTLHDDLTEGIQFSPPKFSSEKSEMSMDIENIQDDVMTDPVLMYLKHDDDKAPKIGSNSSIYSTSSTFFSQPISSNSNMSFESQKDWMSHIPTHSGRGVTSYTAQQAVNVSQPNFSSGFSNVISNSSDNSTLESHKIVQDSSLSLSVGSTSNNTTHSAEPSNYGKVGIESGHKSHSDSAKSLQTSPYKKKNNSTSNLKTSDGKPGKFGVNRRKSSNEKSKIPPATLNKTRKSLSIDSDFGFDSDDDTEPTIRLSKPTGKSKGQRSNKQQSNKLPEPNLLPHKPRTANASAGAELKNQMEDLKRLHEQQEMLMKIHQFQAQHSGTPQATMSRNLHHNMNTQQPSAVKSQTVNYQRQTITNDKPGANPPILPKYPTLPQLPKISQPTLMNKRPSVDFSASFSSVTRSSDVPSKEDDVPSFLSHHQSISQRIASTTLSHDTPVFTPTSSQTLPHFLNFLETPATCTTSPISGLTPYSMTPIAMSRPTSVSTMASKGYSGSSVSLPPNVALFFPPKATVHSVPSSTVNNSHVSQHFLSSSSALNNIPVPQQKLASFFPSSESTTGAPLPKSTAVSAPQNFSMSFGGSSDYQNLPRPISSHFAAQSKEKSSNSNLDISQLPNKVPSSTRPQPFDSAHFDLEWLHREPDNRLSEKHRTPESVRSSALPSSQGSSFQNTPSSAQIGATAALTTTTSKPALHSVSEDNALPLKQSIHTVDHVKIPKPQAAQQPAISLATNKDGAPVFHETKHLNLKKHRILDGYPHSSENYKSTLNTPNTSQPNGIPPPVAHSVLDKQRRYSKERSNKKPSHRVFHQVTDAIKTHPLTLSNHSGTKGHLEASSKITLQSRSHTILTDHEKSISIVTKSGKKEDVVKDDQAGSMLSLFNSLLQEASESAADSLKNKPNIPEEGPPGAVSPEKVPVQALVATQKPSDIDKSKSVVGTSKMPASLVTPCPTTQVAVQAVPSKKLLIPCTTAQSTVLTVPSKKLPISCPTTQTTLQAVPSAKKLPTNPTIQPATQVVPAKKIPKKKRPVATVPFKRRPYPPIDDLEAMNLSVNTKSLPTTTSVSQPISTSVTQPISTSVTSVFAPSSVIVSTPSSTNTITTQSASVAKSVTTSVLLTQTTTHSSTSMTTADVVESDTANSSPIVTGLPKLRITMFRSSKGQVIHQSSMVGSNIDDDAADSDTVHRKHKKRKKRKKRRKLSSSDYDSSVSSMTSMSSFEPSVKFVQVATKVDETISKVIEKTIEQEQSLLITSTPIIKIAPIADSPKLIIKTAIIGDSLKPPQKRKRTKANTVENTEKKKPVKRVKVTKPITKKKTDTKMDEPIARYQPKSALQPISNPPSTSVMTRVSVTLPSTFHRAPGKLPMYLSSSDSKSATVPTIQLVARNTKLLETVVNNKTPQPAKVVSMKISNARTTNSLPTQLLTNPAVQYIIPNSRGQQRIILPNISTPITMPVSIVSPLLGRSIPSGLFPVSVCPLTTTSSNNKPQFFSMPISISDTISTPGNFSGNKQIKSRWPSSELSPTKSTSITIMPLSEATNLVSGQASTSGTVMGTLVLPRVTTKVTPSLAPTPISANSFQSTFSKLISSQNPVPRYVPPNPPDHLKIDLSATNQFQCLECKDSFMFSESLEDHYGRKCILIKVRCMQCNNNLVFLNKCKLLLHARQHSDKGNGMQFNNAHISPLPLSMCKPRSKESFLNKSASSERRKPSVASSEDECPSVNTSTSSDTVMACSECNFVTTNHEALEEHFQRESPPPSPDIVARPIPTANFTCDMCSLTVPNQCSFNAHMRMHKRSSPHTCPECGKIFDNDGLKEQAYSDSRKETDFNLHLSIECFHLSRMSCYKCRICSSIFKNAELIRRHLEVRHLQTFYKCRDCPMAFKTQENISSHQRSAHGVVAATKTIHKCPLCDTVFTDNSPTQQLFLLQKHFEAHINHPSINITAYKCLFCNNIYERKSLLREHLKSAHEVTSTNETCTADLTKETKESKMLIDLNKKDNAATGKKVTTKKRSNTKVSSKEPMSKVPKILSPDRNSADTASNLLIASGILGNVEGSGKKSLSGKVSSSAPPATMKSARQPVKLRLKGMIANSANSLSSASTSSSCTISADSLSSLADELSNNVPTIMRDGKKVYPCGDCSKELPSASARLNHIRLKHKGIRTLYCCPYCPVDKIKFAKKISLKKHLKRVHSIEEMKKHDVRIEYARIPVGQRFDPATFNAGRDESQNTDSTTSVVTEKHLNSDEPHKVRKKVTSIGRKNNDEKSDRRPMRQSRRNMENGSPYVDNSDSEVEQITRNYVEDAEKSESESPDFSLLRFPDMYTCAKCDYQSKDRLEFQGHIIEHREDGEFRPTMFSTMQQCTECGLCFASLASHNKHLFIKHKIKRRRLLEMYNEQLRAGGALLKSENRAGVVAKRHRCSVCYRRFDDAVQLRTHMRTHGLAFVKSKHVT